MPANPSTPLLTVLVNWLWTVARTVPIVVWIRVPTPSTGAADGLVGDVTVSVVVPFVLPVKLLVSAPVKFAAALAGVVGNAVTCSVGTLPALSI